MGASFSSPIGEALDELTKRATKTLVNKIMESFPIKTLSTLLVTSISLLCGVAGLLLVLLSKRGGRFSDLMAIWGGIMIKMAIYLIIEWIMM